MVRAPAGRVHATCQGLSPAVPETHSPAGGPAPSHQDKRRRERLKREGTLLALFRARFFFLLSLLFCTCFVCVRSRRQLRALFSCPAPGLPAPCLVLLLFNHHRLHFQVKRKEIPPLLFAKCHRSFFLFVPIPVSGRSPWAGLITWRLGLHTAPPRSPISRAAPPQPPPPATASMDPLCAVHLRF